MAIHGPNAPAPATANSLSSQLVISLSPERCVGVVRGGSNSRRSPRSRRCAHAVATIPTYDGLYANELGHAKRRVFRDPSLLITGRTTLPFVVEKP